MASKRSSAVLEARDAPRCAHSDTGEHALAEPSDAHNMLTFRDSRERATCTSSAAKRILDLVFSTVALVVSAPLLLVVSVLVRLTLGAPILFHQLRSGLNGRPFRIHKFRTMIDVRDSSGELLPSSNRVTRLGCLLRSTSLDELPELWNVLMGEMSFVGPRPLLTEYLHLYTSEQARRHSVRPGMTGWAQINGRNAIGWEERLDMDVWYVDQWSLALDFRILVETVRLVLLREGISAPGHVGMPRFTGSRPGHHSD
jgi:sugar transferase EpsL